MVCDEIKKRNISENKNPNGSYFSIRMLYFYNIRIVLICRFVNDKSQNRGPSIDHNLYYLDKCRM